MAPSSCSSSPPMAAVLVCTRDWQDVKLTDGGGGVKGASGVRVRSRRRAAHRPRIDC